MTVRLESTRPHGRVSGARIVSIAAWEAMVAGAGGGGSGGRATRGDEIEIAIGRG